MTTTSTSKNSSLNAQETRVDTMDLSPQGLADAPANEQDHDSIVYAGNS